MRLLNLGRILMSCFACMDISNGVAFLFSFVLTPRRIQILAAGGSSSSQTYCNWLNFCTLLNMKAEICKAVLQKSVVVKLGISKAKLIFFAKRNDISRLEISYSPSVSNNLDLLVFWDNFWRCLEVEVFWDNFITFSDWFLF